MIARLKSVLRKDVLYVTVCAHSGVVRRAARVCMYTGSTQVTPRRTPPLARTQVSQNADGVTGNCVNEGLRPEDIANVLVLSSGGHSPPVPVRPRADI